MKNYLFLFWLMITSTASYAGNPEIVKKFYVSYMTNFLKPGNSNNIGLCQEYLTKALMEKNGRVVSASGANPIISAQDVNQDAVETLTVGELGDDWYLVKYQWKKGDASSETQIPLKAYEIDNEFRIVYISPYWNGSQYGDYLIADKRTGEIIDNRSELSFLTSFYHAYTHEYGLMETGLADRLSKLRNRYLTKNAKADFDKAEQEELLDHRDGFDLLINNFDFEYVWTKSVEIKPLGDNEYLVSFDCNGRPVKIKITLSKEKNQYMIDRIQRYGK